MKKSILKAITCALLVSSSTLALAQRISVTITGNGVASFSGDDGPCSAATISGPKDVCMDAAQNIYFVDKANGRIRKVAAVNGIITTIGGGGTSLADGVPATAASLTPNYMCIGTTGNIYFSTGNQIRMINSATNAVSTVAGTGTAGYTGDSGPAVAATLNTPEGLCIDASNNIYIVDRYNNCIRKVDGITSKISTIAGNGVASYTGDGGPATAAEMQAPVAITIDPARNLYFSDQSPSYPSYDNSVIRKLDATTGIITTIAGTATGAIYDVKAIDATLGTITGLFFAKSGELYCNEMSCSCRKINFTTDTLYEVAGNFGIESYSNDTTAPLANMNVPYGLCVDNYGSIYVADSNNQRIRKIIQLSKTPMFAYGHGQYIEPAAGASYLLDSLLWITDLDPAQTETWTVVTAPKHGILSGFPFSTTSRADTSTTKPVGLSYTTASSYAGADQFRVRISDGGLSDTITVYVGPHSGDTDPLSVAATAVTSGISLFPNPATSLINIQYSDMQPDNNDVVISDVANHILYKTTVASTSGSIQVNVATLPTGIYFVRVGGTELSKFVKE